MAITLEKPQIIVKNGKPKSVVLGIKDYQLLLELAEDKEDLAELHRIKKGKTSFRELGNYLKNVYRVLLEGGAEKNLEALAIPLRKRIIERLLLLRNNPRPAATKKLVGSKNAWRIREGDWRIIYEVNDKTKEVKVYR